MKRGVNHRGSVSASAGAGATSTFKSTDIHLRMHYLHVAAGFELCLASPLLLDHILVLCIDLVLVLLFLDRLRIATFSLQVAAIPRVVPARIPAGVPARIAASVPAEIAPDVD
eukprot:tig00021133_g18921.t1